MGFFKWFTSKAKMKRWMFLILLGVVLICYGIANILYFNTLGIIEILKIVNVLLVGMPIFSPLRSHFLATKA